MSMNVFNYNTLTKQLEINEPELLLVKEFKALIQRDKSVDKERVTRELSYIYLAIDWKSPYSQYSEHERHDEAISDSGLSESNLMTRYSGKPVENTEHCRILTNQ